MTYYGNPSWLRKPMFLAVLGDLELVNRGELLTLPFFLLKCFSRRIKMLFSANKKCNSTTIKPEALQAEVTYFGINVCHV